MKKIIGSDSTVWSGRNKLHFQVGADTILGNLIHRQLKPPDASPPPMYFARAYPILIYIYDYQKISNIMVLLNLMKQVEDETVDEAVKGYSDEVQRSYEPN